MRRSPALLVPIALALCALGCSGSRSHLPDYSEWLHAGVDPQAEADALLAGLERAGYALASRIDGEGWIALDARRGEEVRAIRVVTSRGAALVLDSHEPDGVLPRHGRISLVAPARDLDADGDDEIVVGAEHGEQTCLLPFRVADDGEIRPLVPDLGELGPDACVESFRDVDENGRLEAIAVVRLPSLARAEIPAVDAPLELDEQGHFRAGPPAVRFVEQERAARAAALDAAVAEADVERVYRLAIELAALARIAGNATEAQLAAFDSAIARIAVGAAIAPDVEAARALIARGWTVAEPRE